MTDSKLKIRIQIPPSSQSDGETQHSTDMHEALKGTEKAPFDMQKIFITLFVVFLSIGSFVYLVFIDETEPAAKIADQSIVAHDSEVIVDESFSTTPIEPVDPADHLSVSSFTEEKVLNTATTQSIESEPLDTPLIADEQNISEAPEPIIEVIESIEPNLTELAPLITTNPDDQHPVIQAQLTSAIHQKEPVDEIDHIALNQGASVRIHFFMRLRDLAGQNVSVRWFYQNNEVAALNLPIGNNEQWRTHANKLLSKTRLGQWHVELHDASGNLLAQRNFTVSNKP